MSGSFVPLTGSTHFLGIFNVCAVIDGMGLYGHFLHYGIVISLVGSAFLIFLYLWRHKRLDADEGPKFQMMQEEEIQQGEPECCAKKKKK